MELNTQSEMIPVLFVPLICFNDCDVRLVVSALLRLLQ